MVERVLQGTPNLISQPFYQGSTPADPGVVAVTVRSDDGTTVATGNASGTGTNPRTFALTAAHTANLDRLSVTWASTALGTPPPMTVEVVGGFLFATRDITGYDDAAIQDARTRAEQTLEQAVGFAFVPRYSRKTLSGMGSSPLRVSKPYLRRIRWATVSGTALTTGDLALLSYDAIGQVYGYGFPVGYGNVTAGVEHGRDEPDEPVRAAARELAESFLSMASGTSGINPRAERMVTEDGTLIFGRGATGLPSVDRVIDGYRIPTLA